MSFDRKSQEEEALASRHGRAFALIRARVLSLSLSLSLFPSLPLSSPPVRCQPIFLISNKTCQKFLAAEIPSNYAIPSHGRAADRSTDPAKLLSGPAGIKNSESSREGPITWDVIGSESASPIYFFFLFTLLVKHQRQLYLMLF